MAWSSTRWCRASTRRYVGAQELQGLVYLNKVAAAGGAFMHIPTGNAQQRPCCPSDLRDGPKALSAQTSSEMSAAECPLVAYPQGGADYCAAYGLASALHAYGDAAAAASVASSARSALASGDAFGHIRNVVRSEAAGWSEVPLSHHDPLRTHIAEPISTCSWSAPMGPAGVCCISWCCVSTTLVHVRVCLCVCTRVYSAM